MVCSVNVCVCVCVCVCACVCVCVLRIGVCVRVLHVTSATTEHLCGFDRVTSMTCKCNRLQ